ncbi:hypothetical protein I4U23_015946 [Adineta vaga]|nr:hypothetical protein I4U23_015946 [Adineta vaga]
MAECEHLRVGGEFLKSVSWPSAFRQKAHDRCYCNRCYSSNLADTLTVAGYTYVIPRGWTRFAVSVDESFFNHHKVWDTWLNCYHGTTIENAISCVEHRTLLLPNDTTMHGKKLEIRKGHIPGEHFAFTTPSINYAALDYYAHKYDFRSPYNLQLYSIKVALQCKQKPDSIIVQGETVKADQQGIRICSFIPNNALEWKTKHRSSVMIYGVLLEIKRCYENDDPSNSLQYQQISNTQSTTYVPIAIPEKLSVGTSKVENISNSEPASLPIVNEVVQKSMSKKKIALFIMLAIATFLPLTTLIIGQIYKNDCPIQPWIPRWMTVFGAVGLSTFPLIFIIMFITFKRCSDDITIGSSISGCITCLLVFFFLAWLITGSVWVFPARSKVQYDQPNEAHYCRENLYKFAFGLLLVQYSLIGLLICCSGIVAVCSMLF